MGEERIPAGPNVEESDAIIIVEGRADVLNLLRYGIKNSVAVEGTNVPGIIIGLCEKKTTTVFLDGDRGGELILREILQIADVDFVAYPPRGKSVEDLSRKEIVKALRNKVPVEYVRDQFEKELQKTGQSPVPEPAPASILPEPYENGEGDDGMKADSFDIPPVESIGDNGADTALGKHLKLSVVAGRDGFFHLISRQYATFLPRSL